MKGIAVKYVTDESPAIKKLTGPCNSKERNSPPQVNNNPRLIDNRIVVNVRFVICWAVAAGEIRRANTKSTPTIRIAWATVMAKRSIKIIDKRRTGTPLVRATSGSMEEKSNGRNKNNKAIRVIVVDVVLISKSDGVTLNIEPNSMPTVSVALVV